MCPKYLVTLGQEKRVAKWTDRPYMTIPVDWDVKHQNKTKKQEHLFDSLRPINNLSV